jgi:WhiB family redox-sensing transcriptional regulator
VIHNAAGWELEPTPWMARAACAGSSPGLWFPPRGGSATEAKTVCAICPVQAECLAYALRWDIRHGVWGGRSGDDRSHLPGDRQRPRRLKSPHGTTSRYARGCRCDACRAASTTATRERKGRP